MSVQLCEGIWRNRLRQRVVVTQCEPVDGQRWTDGAHHFEDNGALLTFSHSNLDLVEYIGPLPDGSQRAPVSRPAETESTTTVAAGVSEDPGRIIYNLEQRLEAAKNRNRQAQEQLAQRHQTINDQTAEIDRLKGEWQTEFSAAQQLRSENDQLKAEIERLQAELRGYAAESHRQLRTLQASHDSATATLRAEQRGAQQAYLAAIKTFLEASR